MFFSARAVHGRNLSPTALGNKSIPLGHTRHTTPEAGQHAAVDGLSQNDTQQSNGAAAAAAAAAAAQ